MTEGIAGAIPYPMGRELSQRSDVTFKGLTAIEIIGKGFRMVFPTQIQLNTLQLSRNTLTGYCITKGYGISQAMC